MCNLLDEHGKSPSDVRCVSSFQLFTDWAHFERAQLKQVKARQYVHELMEYLFSKEELEESEKLFVYFTNRGFTNTVEKDKEGNHG